VLQLGCYSKKANVSDTKLNDRFWNTALYGTVCAVLPREDQPEVYEMLPDEALFAPSPPEIASRWRLSRRIIAWSMNRLGELDLDDDYHRWRERL
jgi:nuclear pore complex protein Nup133